MLKKLFLLLVISISLTLAQSQDSLQTADSISISEMVQNQIFKAQQKVKIPVQNKELQVLSQSTPQSDFTFNGIQMKLALLFVMIITAAYMLVKKRKNKEDLVLKPASLVIKPAAVIEPEKRSYEKELKLIRTGLKDNAPFFMLSEQELSNAARDLKISKGELYLAAILKSQEIAKIKKNMFGVYND